MTRPARTPPAPRTTARPQDRWVLRLAVFALLTVCTQPVLAQLRAPVFVSGFTAPVAFVQDPSNPAVQFVVEQAGRIRAVRDGDIVGTFLDLTPAVLSGGEQGLLGLAFPPDYASNGRFYVNFTRSPDGHTVIARFRRSANPLMADPSSRFDLIWSTGLAYIPQPFSNHNGGCLEFGPDGYLYVALGDGGSGNDPENRAQRPTELLGKILRIDVSVPDTHPQGFAVPPGNPGFARPEIWSLGLRNPWKFSFDPPSRGGTGAMVIADVGQNAWEEIDYEPPGRPGRNYGWRNREGAHDNVQTTPPTVLPLVDPIFEYPHSAGTSISGGHVYRGAAIPALRGRYVFGDFTSRRVWSIALNVNPATGEATAGNLSEHTQELGGPAALGGISAFGLDAAGELYIVSYTTGAILKLVGVPPVPGNLRIVRELEEWLIR